MALTSKILGAPISRNTFIYDSLPTSATVIADGGQPGDNVYVTGGASYILSAGHALTTVSPVVGFVTGSGGAVTQITSRATGVTLNTICGTITTDSTSLAAAAEATFTVTNSMVAANDVVVCCVKSGGTTPGSTWASVTAVGAGSFAITVTNLHASTADTAALVINFAVIKSVAA